MADAARAADPIAFDETIHAPLRLRTCGLLRPVDRLDFGALRDTLGVSDASLSKQLKVLVEAGYVSIDKSASIDRADLRRLTWITLTVDGRRAFDGHMAALRAIAGAAT